jgi:hypothetical protein
LLDPFGKLRTGAKDEKIKNKRFLPHKQHGIAFVQSQRTISKIYFSERLHLAVMALSEQSN